MLRSTLQKHHIILEPPYVFPIFLQASAGLMRKYRVEHPEEFRKEVERQFEAPDASAR